jgi:hypothetical protein
MKTPCKRFGKLNHPWTGYQRDISTQEINPSISDCRDILDLLPPTENRLAVELIRGNPAHDVNNHVGIQFQDSLGREDREGNRGIMEDIFSPGHLDQTVEESIWTGSTDVSQPSRL